MGKKSVIKLPNGTTIEVSPDLTPDQITAMITALTTGNTPETTQSSVEEDDSGKVYVHHRSIEEIWESSKKEKVALFIRTYMSENLWFSAKDIMEQQISVTGQILLGETSAIGTYLNRLFESGFLDKKKSQNGRNVYYRMADKLVDEYPLVPTEKFQILVTQ